MLTHCWAVGGWRCGSTCGHIHWEHFWYMLPRVTLTLAKPSLCNNVGAHSFIWLVLSHSGYLPFHHCCCHNTPCTPLIPKHPIHPHFSGTIFASYALLFCIWTFSHRPDEAVSVWRQWKLVFNNLIYCFLSALRRYHILTPCTCNTTGIIVGIKWYQWHCKWHHFIP